MDKDTRTLLGVMVLITVGVVFLSVTGLPSAPDTTEATSGNGEFTTFDSQAAFQNYTQQESVTASLIGMQQMRGTTRTVTSDVQPTRESGTTVSADTAQVSTESAGVSRDRSVSTRQTNTQEQHVGEPDIVKVTPETTYYAQQHVQHGGVQPLPGPIGIPETTVQRPAATDTTPQQPHSKDRNQHTPRVQQVTNPNTGNVSVTGELNVTGNLLRSNNTLVAYNNSVITGYDVQNNGANAEQAWRNEINTSHTVVTTRRVGSTAYLVTRERTQSCPVHPVPEHGRITCSDVYHPTTNVGETDSVYTVMSVDMETGDIRDELSFVGSRDTTTYMSEDTMYVAYNVVDFNVNDVIDIVLEMETVSSDDAVTTELRELKDLNVSDEAKLAELQHVLEQHEYDDSEFTQRLQQGITTYVEENRRDIFTSQIVSLDVSDGDITPSDTGSVPGTPLNQFSFDEHDDELRVATTVTPDNRQASKNDVYVLNDALKITGSVQGMAEGQRIYGVRFMGDTGYVITYRQVDPLHVIDLRDSTNPEEVGAVKLPGFSEYLHQVGDGELLGVGESDGGNGKVVLFNVSDESDPQVSDSLVVDEWSTAVSESHHAFMTDGELNHAYVPAGNSLYVIDYSNGTVTREGVVELESSVKRTRMYGDEIMAFSDTEIAVIDKKTYNVSETVTL